MHKFVHISLSVILISGARIDHGHHAGVATLALTDTLAMDAALSMAQSMTNEQETLTIVTADHSHTMTFGGYPSRGNDILGKYVHDGDVCGGHVRI